MQNDITKNGSITLIGSFSIPVQGDDKKNIDMMEETYIIKIVISITLVISLVFSVIGNIFTCTVIVKDRTMRTPTNCYLANIAITDLLISCFIPIEIYLIWIPDLYPLGKVGCRLHFILLDIFSTCNLLIITAFTVERYFVVTKPFLRQKLLKNSRVNRIVGFIWVLSLSISLPDILYIDLLERKKYVFCYFSLSGIASIFIGIEFIVFYIIPMLTIAVIYILIAYELKSEHKRLRNNSINAKQNRDKAIKMLAAVAGTFFFFWTPFCIARIMMVYPDFNYDDNQTVWKILNYLCYSAYLATAVNPIVYHLMSKKFRQAFRNFWKGHRNEIKQSEIKKYTEESAML